MATLVKVRRWGNSLAVLIPNRFARSHEIEVGTVIDLEKVRIVKPVRRRYKLSELLRGFKPRQRRGEWNLGAPVGKEIW
jgi:antitoxin MazE